MLNVLMPSAVMTYFSNKIGSHLYDCDDLCHRLNVSFSSLITQHSSWQMVIIVLTALLAITFAIWLPNIKREKQVQAKSSTNEREQAKYKSAWRIPKAWVMLVFSGLQSLLFYTGLTWLPTMVTEAGLSQTLAGNLSGIYSLIGIPLALVLPTFVEAISIRKR